MNRANDDGHRESIWGIDPKDRGWFQLLTLVGGISGSIILTWLEIDYRSGDATLSEIARNIVLGISASFVAVGFIVWGILQAKDLAMPAGDVLREYVKKRRARWMEESREQGRKEGIEQGIEQGKRLGREEALREIYGPDYAASEEKSRPQPPGTGNANGGDGNGLSNGRLD